MRNINRIPKILFEIQSIWEKHPDLRLGQLIFNALNYNNDGLFYIEDEDLIDRLKEDDKENSDENKS